MKRLLALLIAMCRFLVLIATLVLVVSVTVQIFARTFLPVAPIWTEEVTRYSLLYMIAFGTGLSMLSGDLVNVDLFVEWLPERPRRFFACLAFLVTALLSAFILKPTYDFASIGALQTSPAIGISMIWVYSSMVVLVVLMFLFAVVAAIRMARAGHVESGRIGE
jgi:TRAP-type C4-dicarboxylate transport system permease small subunit